MALNDPTLSTTPNWTNITVPPAVALNDTADLEGGFSPTGTITFTLVAPGGTTIDTETVSVNGNGLYSTSNGYDFTPGFDPAGTYQWNAVYSGDANNNGVVDLSDPAERVTVNVNSPTLSATPDSTHVTLTRDAERHGGPGGRLRPDGHPHLHAGRAGRHHARHRDGAGQRRRLLHYADRLHARRPHRGWHLPVERHLHRRRQQHRRLSTIPPSR